MDDYAEDFSPELESNDDLMSEEDEAGSASDQEPDPEPEAPEEEPSDPEPEAPEEVPSEPEPEAPEETPNEPEPEAPPTEETEDGSESLKDLIDAIGNLNETITGAVTQEPEELPEEGAESGGGSGGNVVVEESAGVDLTPVVQVLEHTNELLVKQEEVLVTQHNDLLQLRANVDFVFLAVAALIGVVLGVAVGKLFHDLWRA